MINLISMVVGAVDNALVCICIFYGACVLKYFRMLVEVMVVVVEGLKIFSVKFALNMVMKLHFVIIAMKVIQFDCGGEYKLFSKVPE